jgi:hypothetical protein
MRTNEKKEFAELLEKLYAGFNMPVSAARTTAYWEGLGKMSLGQFARCVEQCLGENGPERIPSVPALWKIAKGMRAEVPKPPSEPLPTQDRPLLLVNGLFLKYLARRRLQEGFRGFLDIPLRRRACLNLVEWISAWDREELDSQFTEIERLFNNAMAEIQEAA